MLRLPLAIVLLLPSLAFAQAERYELGQRLKAFEQAWDKQPDKEARKRALAILPKVTQQFFSLQLGEAGRTLDEARWALESKEGPSDAVKWLTSLYAVPEKRLIDASAKELKIEVKQFYKVKGEIPEGASITIRIDRVKNAEIKVAKIPSILNLPLAGEYYGKIIMTASLNGKSICTKEMEFAAVKDLIKSLKESKELLDKIDPAIAEQRTIASATYRDQVALIESLIDGDVPETDFPVVGILHSMKSERISASFDVKAIPTPPGTFRTHSLLSDDFQSLPIGKTKTLPFRMLPQDQLKLSTPVPLVIALHGAGGTENLFFEGYGNGYIVKECKKRGWILVSPRSPMTFTGGPPVKKLIEALAKDYPIDQSRIFLVGHSMGAMQTIALCQEHPKLFAAAAALGGGGRVTDAKVFDKLPLFIGVGSNDFLLSGAKALNKSLTDSGAKSVTFKEYPDLEHLVIVREALPDVFVMFDKISDASQKR